MPGWRVVLTPDFNTRAKAITRTFRDAVATGKTRADFEKAFRRSRNFDVFLDGIIEMRNGTIPPEDVLKHFGQTDTGLPVYVFAVGRWHGVFLVSWTPRECRAVGIVEASLAGRVRARLAPYLRDADD
jgi:hypothetical protein